MPWQAGGTILAIYLAMGSGLACLWPGLMKRQSQQHLARLLWWVVCAHVAVFYFLIFCDIYLIHVQADSAVFDHLRRVGARWAWVGIYSSLALLLWWRSPYWRRGSSLACLCVVVLLLTGASSPVVPWGVLYGNRRSAIVHWQGCPNYPKAPIDPQRWLAFATLAEAEAAGYRPARNCRPRAMEHASP